MRKALLICMALLGCHAAAVQAAQAIPEALQPWQGWVLHGQEFRACPFLSSGAPDDAGSHRCAWPGRLVLALDARGGEFHQGWQVYIEDWVTLPGNIENWPRDVRVDGAVATVVARSNLPSLRLSAGTHSVSGKFVWNERPEMLPVASSSAIIDLTLDGKSVQQPERPGGAIWLGQRRAAVERQQVQVQVYRLLRDEIPAHLTTLLRLQVSGEGREELLGVALPAGFTALGLDSSLPARLEPDGRLRVQLRPGSFELRLEARGAGVAQKITRPASNGTWATDEIWSFEGNDRLRVAAVEGAESIDPGQANVPGDWQQFPAFRLPAGGSVTVTERSRGLANLDDNQLALNRDLWLDFNHEGFTAVDAISGTLHRDWRLDMKAPYQLKGARENNANLLVTAGPAKDTSGVELRSPQVSLATTARLTSKSASVPATGWTTRFDKVSGTLHLPPGHRLLGVVGADESFGSWISQWGLWNLFGALILVVFTFWVAGPIPAAVAAAALALMYQESPQLAWLWANLLAAIAIVRAAPAGRLRGYISRYRILSLVVLVLAMLPMLLSQMRMALYPQLDTIYEAGPVASPMIILADTISDKKLENRTDRPRPPMMDMPREVDKSELGEVTAITSVASVSQRYASGTLLQTGPGVPDWHYHDYPYSWSGPVDAAQSVHFVYLRPWALSVWRVLGVLLTVAWLLLLARAASLINWNIPARWVSRRGAVSAALVVVIASLSHAPEARAQATPDLELLQGLARRLAEPPKCLPSCVEITNAELAASGDRLNVKLNASALTSIALSLPQAGDRWQYDSVTLDGKPALTVAREVDGSVWIALTPGAHVITISGRLGSADSIQVNFPQPPRVVSVTAQGWDASGVSNARLVAGSVELVRRRLAANGAALLATSEFPAYVAVSRAFSLDLDWTIQSTVQRRAPRTAPLQVEVPLVAGESVLTPGLELRGGNRVLVGLGRGQEVMSWSSALARSGTVEISLAADANRSELWTFAVSPQWHVEFVGVPASLPEDGSGGRWVYHYYPRAGETLKVTVTRPEPVAGSTLAVNSARYTSAFGKRSLDERLDLGYRSTQGGRHAITLPLTARVTSVLMDGQELPLRPEKGVLAVSLLPGEHTMAVSWTEARGAGLLTRPDRVDLGTPASNLHTSIQLPGDRWTLFVHGRGVGPALLYWGELVVFLAIAWGLGRLPISPLKSWEWLVLGLGLSTQSWFVFLAVVVWLLVMRWRERWNHAALPPLYFNVAQVALAGLTVGVVGSLVFSGVRFGLLSAPDMGLQGPGSYIGLYEWFLDRTDALLSQPVVVSAPIWIYKTLMFAWALWIALALARWLRFAWSAWTQGGYWRGKAKVATT